MKTHSVLVYILVTVVIKIPASTKYLGDLTKDRLQKPNLASRLLNSSLIRGPPRHQLASPQPHSQTHRSHYALSYKLRKVVTADFDHYAWPFVSIVFEIGVALCSL